MNLLARLAGWYEHAVFVRGVRALNRVLGDSDDIDEQDQRDELDRLARETPTKE